MNVLFLHFINILIYTCLYKDVYVIMLIQACLYKLTDTSIAGLEWMPQAPSLAFGLGASFVSRLRSQEQKQKEGLFYECRHTQAGRRTDDPSRSYSNGCSGGWGPYAGN